jgi:spermidine/putrescine transport system permease protein
VTGPGADTLPLKIYSMIKHSRQMPVINSLSTLMLVMTCVLVAASRLVANRKRRPRTR